MPPQPEQLRLSLGRGCRGKQPRFLEAAGNSRCPTSGTVSGLGKDAGTCPGESKLPRKGAGVGESLSNLKLFFQPLKTRRNLLQLENPGPQVPHERNLSSVREKWGAGRGKGERNEFQRAGAYFQCYISNTVEVPVVESFPCGVEST